MAAHVGLADQFSICLNPLFRSSFCWRRIKWRAGAFYGEFASCLRSIRSRLSPKKPRKRPTTSSGSKEKLPFNRIYSLSKIVYNVRTSMLFTLPFKKELFHLPVDAFGLWRRRPPWGWLSHGEGRISNVSICVPKSPEVWNNKGRVFSALFASVLRVSQPNVPLSRGGRHWCVKVKTRGGKRAVPHQRALLNIQDPGVAFGLMGQNERRLRD